MAPCSLAPPGREPQGAPRPVGPQPRPQGLERSASNVADVTAFFWSNQEGDDSAEEDELAEERMSQVEAAASVASGGPEQTPVG